MTPIRRRSTATSSGRSRRSKCGIARLSTSSRRLPHEGRHMRVVEIRDEAGLVALREPWTALIESMPSATTFVTWEWMSAWWAAYGKAGDLRVLTAHDDQGILRGIAPLCCRSGQQ